MKYPTLKQELEAAGMLMPYYVSMGTGITQVSPELIVTMSRYEDNFWGGYSRYVDVEKINNDLSMSTETEVPYGEYTADFSPNWVLFRLY